MKIVGFAGTAIVLLTLGLAAPTFADREPKDDKEDSPKQQQGKQKRGRAKPHSSRQEPRSGYAQQQAQHAAPPRQAVQSRQIQRGPAPRPQGHGGGDHGSVWRQHRARSWQSDHRTWEQRGGYHGYRVTHDRFTRYFGPQHGFRIHGLPFLVVSGHPRFQYQGYWVSVLDPYPESWSDDWYDTDDVYVTTVNDGYYLSNRSHPDVHLAIQISM